MATLIAAATGNFTTAGTWGVADTTSFLDSEVTSTTLTTSLVASAAWTSTAITVDGVAVKVANSRLGTPTGTMTIELFDSTASSVKGTLTIDVADLPAGVPRWVFFKFSGGSAALTNGNNHTIRAKTSSATQVSLFRDATSNNWSRALRRTTTQAPAAADILIIGGEHTGQGTGNSFTVTMDNTATTNWGKTTVGSRATFAFGTAAATAYQFKIAGLLELSPGGTITVGTVGTPVPSGTTHNIEFMCASPAQYGFQVYGGTLTMYGASKTVKAMLAADASAAATSITTNVSTNWSSGDSLAIASTTRTPGDSENVTMSGAATGTSVPVSALAAAHSGTSPTAGEVINLTRNIVVKGTSTTNASYVLIGTTAVVSVTYAEFSALGGASAGSRGIEMNTTTGSCLFQYCSAHDFTVAGADGFLLASASTDNVTIDSCVLWNIASGTSAGAIAIAATTGTNWTVSNCVAIKTNSTNGMFIGDLGGTFTNNTIVSSAGSGIQFGTSELMTGTYTGNVSHSNAISGFAALIGFQGTASTPAVTFTSWRNAVAGFDTFIGVCNLTFTITCFGNVEGVLLRGRCSTVTFLNSSFYGGSTLVQTDGVRFSVDAALANCVFRTCTFGSPSGHATQDLSFTQTGFGSMFLYADILFDNCTFSSSSLVIASMTTTALASGSNGILRFQKFNGVAGSHKSYVSGGIISLDSAIYKAASPSARYTPSSASLKLVSEPHAFTVPSGGNATITVYVRKSVTGDTGGATYNGAQPRLILKANPSAGVAADVVLATATNAANGAWQALTNDLTTAGVTLTDDAVLEVVVDGDGTAGWFNVDDLSAV